MIYRLLLSALLVVTMASAQRGGGRRSDSGGQNMGMMAVQTRFDTISNVLQLSKEQKKAVKTILDGGQKEAAPLRDQLSKNLLQIGEAVQAGKGQDDLNQAISGYSAAEANMTRIEMECFAKIYQSLDRGQQSRAGTVFLMMHGIFKGKNWNEAE